MALYKPSTEKEPLRFFSSFLSIESISRYEINFYEHPVNPSQIYNKDQGYIQYHKDCYEEGETPTVKTYFIDYLRKHLETQSLISEDFMIERKNALEYKEVFANRFVQKQLDILSSLINGIDNLPHKELIKDVLYNLNLKITSLLYPETPIKRQGKSNQSNHSFNGFFGNNKYSSRIHLKKLYDVLLEIDVIDEAIVSDDNFINVLTSTKPDEIDDVIQFSVDNYGATIFIMELAKYFDCLTFAKIEKSKSFKTRIGKGFFSATSLSRSKSDLTSRHHKKFKNIPKAIKQVMPKIK